jgi:hypothetical protein
MREHIVAVFESDASAAEALRALEGIGIPASAIRRYKSGRWDETAVGTSKLETTSTTHLSGGFWAWLFGEEHEGATSDVFSINPALSVASMDKCDDGATTDTITVPGATNAADSQERVQAMAAAGVNVIVVETLPATVAGGWHKVPLWISLNASWEVLMELVRAIERSPTRIFIDDVHFHSPVVIAHPAASPIQASTVYGFSAANAGAGT